jgi:hypothetical protein
VCLCVYVQTPNAADLRRGGTCGWHPLGAGRYFTVGVDNVLLLYMERRQVDRQGTCSDAEYNCRNVNPLCRSPPTNFTDVIVSQRAVSKCPLTQTLSTPEREVRYGFRTFVLTNVLLFLPHTSHDVLRPFTDHWCARRHRGSTLLQSFRYAVRFIVLHGRNCESHAIKRRQSGGIIPRILNLWHWTEIRGQLRTVVALFTQGKRPRIPFDRTLVTPYSSFENFRQLEDFCL